MMPTMQRGATNANLPAMSLVTPTSGIRVANEPTSVSPTPLATTAKTNSVHNIEDKMDKTADDSLYSLSHEHSKKHSLTLLGTELEKGKHFWKRIHFGAIF